MRSLKKRLDQLVDGTDGASRREADPVAFVHRFADPRDQELVGLLAASLAFGNIKAVQRSVSRVLDVLGDSPSAGAAMGRDRLRRRLGDFVHRVYKGPDVAALLHNAARLQHEHGSLGDFFARALADGPGLRPALSLFAEELRGVRAGRGLRHLVPNPDAGSACKRLLLYLRWMIRPADGVDLGLWSSSPSVLLIPVDTHVLRIARNLRLTERKDASWKTAEEITAHLRRFDAKDPVKYDFAICHLGVSSACPSERDATKCASCVLKPVCRHWDSGHARGLEGAE